MGGFIVTPVLLEQGLGYSTAFVGLLIIARPLAFSITAPVAGYVTVRVRERVAGMAGAAVIFVSMMLLAMINGDTSPTFIAVALATSGVGPRHLGAGHDGHGGQRRGRRGPRCGRRPAAADDPGRVRSWASRSCRRCRPPPRRPSGEIGSFANAYHVGAVAALAAVGLAVIVRPTVPAAAGARRTAEALAAATQ